MDITPTIPAGKILIQSYGAGRFRAGQAHYAGSVIVFPDRVMPWGVAAPDDLSIEALAPVLDDPNPVELLLVGLGVEPRPLPKAIRAAVRDRGIAIDGMATTAACRTYNILVGEHRSVAAALIAV